MILNTYILNSFQLYSSNAQCHACFIAYIGCRQTVSENDARLKNVNSVLPLNGMTCNNGGPSVKPPSNSARQDLRTEVTSRGEMANNIKMSRSMK